MAVRFFLTLSLVLYLSPFILGFSDNDIKTWCSQTPHPQPCEYLLSHNKNPIPIKQKSQFFHISTQLALDRAMHAQTNLFSLGSKCENPRAKAAWDDCLELYDHTISKLNTTINPITNCTQEDTQTWLSTALTNLETCREGFAELGESNFLPLMSNNVSKLISNTLSINHVPYNPQPTYKDGFPTWVNPGNRKLLQSTTPTANLVVAKDGSGNYKTVTEAITAASKRSGTARYVIYVKAGTYKENVVIKSTNIMLMGDGIGKTIITGSKSVGGGSTTFNSATVGK